MFNAGALRIAYTAKEGFLAQNIFLKSVRNYS
jgi:hypothetical protein